MPSPSMAEPVPTLLGVPKARWRVALTVLLAAFFLLVPVYAWQAGDSYVLIGSWLINDQPAGIGIREDRALITQDLSRFYPHIFVE